VAAAADPGLGKGVRHGFERGKFPSGVQGPAAVGGLGFRPSKSDDLLQFTCIIPCFTLNKSRQNLYTVMGFARTS